MLCGIGFCAVSVSQILYAGDVFSTAIFLSREEMMMLVSVCVRFTNAGDVCGSKETTEPRDSRRVL